jgi:ribonucleases P/MRP protein subunit RPP40
LDRGHQVDCSYNDFAKAFDRVNHDVLLNKLSKIGFNSKLLVFFASYFKNRSQFVSYGLFKSNTFSTYSGVPQGSNLGPLLFSIFINDITRVISHSRVLLFADDLKLFLEISALDKCHLLQSDINNVLDWGRRNKLNFNVSKCFVMSYTRASKTIYMRYSMGENALGRTASAKDLGILFDSRLSFHAHIGAVCDGARKMLGFVLRTAKVFSDTRVLRLLYNSLVRSRLECGSLIWAPHELKYSLMLEMVQKKFLRYLYLREYGYYPWLYPSEFILGTLGYNSLEKRRNVYLVTHFFRLIRGITINLAAMEQICFYVPDDYLRYRQLRLFYLPACRTNLPMVMPVGRATSLLNRISSEVDIFHIGETHFREQIFRLLE